MFEQQQQSVSDKANGIPAELYGMVSHSIPDDLSQMESNANGKPNDDELSTEQALWDRAEGQ